HLRHGDPGHRLRELEPRLVEAVPRDHAAGRHPRQSVGPQPGDPEVSPMSESTPKDNAPEDAASEGTAATEDGAATATAAPIVERGGVGKSYGNIRALHGVNLSVTPGQTTCVLGDNGAGKSTLIKII